MILIIATLILLTTIMIIWISNDKERLEKEIREQKEELNQLEKKLAMRRGKEEALKEFEKERFYDEYDRFIKAKKEIAKIEDKSREDLLYQAITNQILDKYEELSKDKTMTYQEKEEELLRKIGKIMRTHYHSDWVDELE